MNEQARARYASERDQCKREKNDLPRLHVCSFL